MELDVLDCKKVMRNNNLKLMMTDSNLLINLGSCLSIAGLTVALQDPWLDIFCVGYSLIQAPIIINQIKSYGNNIESLLDALKDNDLYKECLDRYDYYITNVANLLKSVGIKDSVGVCVYVALALRLGYFSKEHCCSYKDYKYDPLYLSDILGARVMQGEYVCRHAARFLNDILEKLNINATTFSVKISDKSYGELNSDERNLLRIDHDINIVTSGKGKFAFDITNYYFANCTENEHEFDIVNNPIDVVVEKNGRYGYIVSDSFIAYCTSDEQFRDIIEYSSDKCFLAKYGMDFLSVYDLKYLPFLNMENMKLSPISICAEQLEVLDIISDTYGDLDNFYITNKKIVDEIALLEEQIAPRSDNLIKKWILK